MSASSDSARKMLAGVELYEALDWALRLAEVALEDCRTLRLRHGHNDIRGTDAKGNVRLGLHQSEVDELDKAHAALAKARGETAALATAAPEDE